MYCNQNLCRMVSLKIVNSWSSLPLRFRRRQICDPFRSQYQISNWEIQRKGNQGAATGWTPWRLHRTVRSLPHKRMLPGNRSATSVRRAGRKFNLLEVGFVCACLGAWTDQHGPTSQSPSMSFNVFQCLLYSFVTEVWCTMTTPSQACPIPSIPGFLACDTNVPNVPPRWSIAIRTALTATQSQ